MRRKVAACAIVCVLVAIGFVLVRVATRNRAEQLNQLPGVGGILSTGLGPFAHEDRLLVFDRSGNQLQLVDQGLRPVNSYPASDDVVRLSVSQDLSIVVALEYQRFCIINTRSKAHKWHALDKMSTEACVSPDGSRLWIGEYNSGIMHLYSLTDLDARRVRSANIMDEADRVIGARRLDGIHDFRLVAIADDGLTTYLYSDAHDDLLIYDWSTGRTVGSIPLPYLHSHPKFVQSPRGDQLAIVANRLVFVDLKANVVTADRELGDYTQAGDFDGGGTQFYVAYSAPAIALPLTHRGGQIDAFDLKGNRLKTWHTKSSRIREFGARGPVVWMVADDGILQTLRLP
jgi:hypothetical protein